MEELIKRLENTRNFVFYCRGNRAAIEDAIQYLKQLQKIKEYLELSLKDSDRNQRKYNEIAEHTHSYNDVYSAKIFEGMSEAYADLLEKFFKEKDL